MDPRKVFHSRCSTWLQVKEPGDTTRFKQHVETCHAKPVPAGGTLVGMGWLKVKDGVRVDGNGKNTTKDKANMPCRGVSDMDNPSINRYLGVETDGGPKAQWEFHMSDHTR
jgi:hypothetical protein